MYLGAAVVSAVSIRAFKKHKEKKSEEEKRHFEQAERERIAKEKWQREKREYNELYGSTSTLIACGAPKDFYVGEDGLPASRKGSEKWGEGFTFYMTSSGQCYHTQTCKIASSHYASPVNAHRVRDGYYWYQGKHKFYPCSYCRPTLPDLSWFDKYQKIKEIRKKYDIPEPGSNA